MALFLTPSRCVLAHPKAVFYSWFCLFCMPTLVTLTMRVNISSILWWQCAALSFSWSVDNHGVALYELTAWCDDNFLELKMSKTNETVFDFCWNSLPSPISVIYNEEIETVSTSKYLSTIFDRRLNWRRLNSGSFFSGRWNLSLSPTVFSSYFTDSTKSVLSFLFICFYRWSTRAAYIMLFPPTLSL